MALERTEKREERTSKGPQDGKTSDYNSVPPFHPQDIPYSELL